MVGFPKVRHCSAPGCAAVVSPRRILCGFHWARLPDYKQNAVSGLIRIGAPGEADQIARDHFLEEEGTAKNEYRNT